MNTSKQKKTAFVVCIKNTDYQASLELHKIYRVVSGDEDLEEEDIRLIDESGEDYLFPSSLFVPIKVPELVENSLLQGKYSG